MNKINNNNKFVNSYNQWQKVFLFPKYDLPNYLSLSVFQIIYVWDFFLLNYHVKSQSVKISEYTQWNFIYFYWKLKIIFILYNWL